MGQSRGPEAHAQQQPVACGVAIMCVCVCELAVWMCCGVLRCTDRETSELMRLCVGAQRHMLSSSLWPAVLQSCVDCLSLFACVVVFV